jgi:hypothetical protein
MKLCKCINHESVRKNLFENCGWWTVPNGLSRVRLQNTLSMSYQSSTLVAFQTREFATLCADVCLRASSFGAQ